MFVSLSDPSPSWLTYGLYLALVMVSYLLADGEITPHIHTALTLTQYLLSSNSLYEGIRCMEVQREGISRVSVYNHRKVLSLVQMKHRKQRHNTYRPWTELVSSSLLNTLWTWRVSIATRLRRSRSISEDISHELSIIPFRVSSDDRREEYLAGIYDSHHLWN